MPDDEPTEEPTSEQQAGEAPAEVAVEAEAVPEPDPTRDPVVAALRRDLGDALVDAVVERSDIWVRVDRSAWFKTIQSLRDRQGFSYFCFLSGIDWQLSTDLTTRHELVFDPPAAAAPETTSAAAAPAAPQWTTGIAGGESRFQVFCRLTNIETHVGITVKADLDEANPEVASLIPLFRGADWHERECWEMFGFIFTGHPDLRHLYLPGEFEGFPMRKDFPLLAREVKPWPGLVDVEPIPGAAGDDEEEG